MKKIFYILASAIVALGAMSCQNEIDENIAPESTNDCTITVNIADTRIAVGEPENGEVRFSVDKGDILELWFSLTSKKYAAYSNFVCQEDGLSFKPATPEDADKFNTYIEHEELSSIEFDLRGATSNNYVYDSKAGADGISFGVVYSGSSLTDFKENRSVTVTSKYAILKYSCTETVTLTSNQKIFYYRDGDSGGYRNSLVVESTGGEVEYIAITPLTADLSYSINDVTVKSITGKQWKANTVYNLGYLGAPVVATVGGAEYTDLQSAVTAAKESGTVTLVSDVAIENLVKVSGNVTISGNATISSATGDVFQVLNGGALTIGEGVTVSSTTDCGIFASSDANNVTVTIDGTVQSESEGFAAVQFNGSTTGITLNVNGKVSNPNSIALYLPAGGTYNINEGAVIEGQTGIYLKGGDLKINGGTITANSENKEEYNPASNGAYSTGDALVVESSDYPAAPPTVTITGGTFTAADGSYAVAHYKQEGKTKGDATITITGGTFSSDPSEFVAEGYQAVSSDNQYIVEVDWSLRGIKNDWDPGIAMAVEGDYYVAKNVEVDANQEFKFRSATGLWKTSDGEITLNAWESATYESANAKITTAGTYDIYLTKNAELFAVMTAGTSVPTIPTKSTHKIYVEDDSDYSNLYVSIYKDNTHVVGWPGVKAETTETINGVSYKVVEFEAYDDATYKILFNNNNYSQVPGKDVVWNGDKYYRVTKKYAEVIENPNSYTGKDDPFTIYVKVNDKDGHTSPSAIKCYIYNSSNNNTWPGKAMTKMSGEAKINNTQYWYYEPDTKFANTDVTVMLNESGWQTSDAHKTTRSFTGDLYYNFYADNYSYIANANAPTM